MSRGRLYVGDRSFSLVHSASSTEDDLRFDLQCFDALPPDLRAMISESDYIVPAVPAFVAIEFGDRRLAVECIRVGQEIVKAATRMADHAWRSQNAKTPATIR